MANQSELLSLVKSAIHFDTLIRQAKEAISKYSGQNWTDTAEHDPGITLLEGYSYNVSDLSYRNTLPLVDLLTPAGADPESGDGIFKSDFGPQIALTSGPISEADYYRALLDLYDEEGGFFYFRNVSLRSEPDSYTYWYDSEKGVISFTPSDSEGGTEPLQLELRGNYTLYVELSRQAGAHQSEASAALDDFLKNNRNLGESVISVVWLAAEAVSPLATIELEDDVQDFAEILAKINSLTEDHISPLAQRYSSAELKEQGQSAEDIYSGPYLRHGWIKNLPEKIDYPQKVTVDLLGLAEVWTSIDGVKSIRSLGLSSDPGSWTWMSSSSESYPAVWGGGENSVKAMLGCIKLISAGGQYVSATEAEVNEKLMPRTVISNDPVILPYGNSRNVAQYFPVTDKIPPCYGLQQEPLAAPPKQLYQFMLAFEQLLANGCQQLSMLPQLLSFQRSGTTVWGEQWPYASGSTGDKVHADYSGSLKAYIQSKADDYDQELAIVGHLLGYFGTQSASRMLNTSADEFIKIEQAYLAQITELAYQRNNIRIDMVSALQKRIAARLGLGIELFEDNADMAKLPFYIVEHRALMPARPSTDYDTASYPTTLVVSDDIFTFTQPAAPTVANMQAGLLVDLVLVGGLGISDNPKETSDFALQALIVDQVDVVNNTFSLKVSDNPLLQVFGQQVKDAQAAGKLYWNNCQVWLRDIIYPLKYKDGQDFSDENKRIIKISPGFPFPALVNVGDSLILSAIRSPSDTSSDWSLAVTVEDMDDIAYTLSVTRDAGQSNAFPSEADVANYIWRPVIAFDRFSFVASVVLSKSILPPDGDFYTTELWIKQCIQAEFPAHVSLVLHWLDEVDTGDKNITSFQDFALSYSQWQATGTHQSIATYQLLWSLSIGCSPTGKFGIGAMVVADSDQQEQVMGKNKDEWHTDVIFKNSLLFVPRSAST